MKYAMFIAAALTFVLVCMVSTARCEEVVYVVNGYCHYLIAPPGFSTVMMLRGSDLQIMKTLVIPLEDAHTGVLTPDNSQLWVSCPNGNGVVVIDTESFEIIKTFDYSGTAAEPMGLAINPGGTVAYAGMQHQEVLRRYYTGSLEEIPGAIDSQVPPEFIVFTPDGTRICVINQTTTSVSVLNAADLSLIVEYNFAVGGLGDAVVSPDGTRLYVANTAWDRIECVSLGPPYEVIAQYATGEFLRPRGIGISPDGNYLFIGHYMPGEAKVTMWQIEPFWASVAVADIADNGRRIAVNRDGTRIYVVDHSADKCYALRVNTAEESMFLVNPYTGTDLNIIGDHKASPIGIAVGDWENIGIFRPSTGLWSFKGGKRVYFGGSGDIVVHGNYNGSGGTEIGIFRPSSGLWAIQGVTRVYFGGSGDIPVPGDYNGDGNCDIGIFRASSGLWSIRGITRCYFGGSLDTPVPGDYSGAGTTQIAIFRESTGLWAGPTTGRIYFGTNGDIPVPGDYTGYGDWAAGIFRPSTGLWSIYMLTRSYFGGSSDQPVPADYDGSGTDDIGVFRGTSGLWAVKGITRAYFGGSGDVPVTR